MRKRFAIILLIFMLHTNSAYAEEEMAFDDSIWMLRATTQLTIGHQLAIMEAFKGCRAQIEPPNKAVCTLLVEKGLESEDRVVETRKAVMATLQQLRSLPATEPNQDHTKALRELLTKLDELPLPLNTIANGVVKPGPR